MKSKLDYDLQQSDWLVEDWVPKHHRVLDAAPEGSFKTIWGIALSVCIAAGIPFLGKPVVQGPVIIIDEDTPGKDLTDKLERFCQGVGKRLSDLPILVFSMTGFKFNDTLKLNEMTAVIDIMKPVFIRMDSITKMIETSDKLNSNKPQAGSIVADTLNQLMLSGAPGCALMITAHSSKDVEKWSMEQVDECKAVQQFVRGSASIVGEACDTAFILKKLSSNPDPSRFAVFTKERRKTIPMAKSKVIVELEEQVPGDGWARLKLVSDNLIPPAKLASIVYALFTEKAKGGGTVTLSSSEVIKRCAFLTKAECKYGTEELIAKKVIVLDSKPQHMKLNPNVAEIPPLYLAKLQSKVVVV